MAAARRCARRSAGRGAGRGAPRAGPCSRRPGTRAGASPRRALPAGAVGSRPSRMPSRWMDRFTEASRVGSPAVVVASWALAWATSRALVRPRREAFLRELHGLGLGLGALPGDLQLRLGAPQGDVVAGHVPLQGEEGVVEVLHAGLVAVQGRLGGLAPAPEGVHLPGGVEPRLVEGGGGDGVAELVGTLLAAVHRGGGGDGGPLVGLGAAQGGPGLEDPGLACWTVRLPWVARAIRASRVASPKVCHQAWLPATGRWPCRPG